MNLDSSHQAGRSRFLAAANENHTSREEVLAIHEILQSFTYHQEIEMNSDRRNLIGAGIGLATLALNSTAAEEQKATPAGGGRTPPQATDVVRSVPCDRQILLTRQIFLPHAQVWATFMDPEAVKRYWQQGNGSITDYEIEVKLGGKFRIRTDLPGGFFSILKGEFSAMAPNMMFQVHQSFEGKMPVPFPDTTYSTTTIVPAGDNCTVISTCVTHPSVDSLARHIVLLDVIRPRPAPIGEVFRAKP